MLPGGIDIGLRSYLTPDFSAMLDPEVWASAAKPSSILFGTGWGNGCLRQLFARKSGRK